MLSAGTVSPPRSLTFFPILFRDETSVFLKSPQFRCLWAALLTVFSLLSFTSATAFSMDPDIFLAAFQENSTLCFFKGKAPCFFPQL